VAAPPPPTPTLLNEDENRVARAMEPYPRHIDDIARQLGMAPGRLAGILLGLELKGVVLQSAGKHFCLKDIS
jgi:DNA processing protein